MPHTEQGFSSAFNLNRHTSMGSALWIGFFWVDLIERYGRSKLFRWFHGPENVYTEGAGLIQMLQEWSNDQVPLSWLIQNPGALVYSPPSIRGAGHLVMSIGPNLMQTAWNASFTTEAFTACIHHFRDARITRDNGGDATRWMLPCLRLQSRGVPLGLAEDLRTVQYIVKDLIQSNRIKPTRCYDTDAHRHLQELCINKSCGVLLDLVSYGGRCLGCVLATK